MSDAPTQDANDLNIKQLAAIMKKVGLTEFGGLMARLPEMSDQGEVFERLHTEYRIYLNACNVIDDKGEPIREMTVEEAAIVMGIFYLAGRQHERSG